MTARLANALYWAFSGLAVVLLLAAVVFSWPDYTDAERLGTALKVELWDRRPADARSAGMVDRRPQSCAREAFAPGGL